MDRIEPRSANDHDDRTTAAAKRVVVETGQNLGSFEGKFAAIGGAVPWALVPETMQSWPGPEHTHRRVEEAVERHFRHAPPLTP